MRSVGSHSTSVFTEISSAETPDIYSRPQITVYYDVRFSRESFRIRKYRNYGICSGMLGNTSRSEIMVGADGWGLQRFRGVSIVTPADGEATLRCSHLLVSVVPTSCVL